MSQLRHKHLNYVETVVSIQLVATTQVGQSLSFSSSRDQIKYERHPPPLTKSIRHRKHAINHLCDCNPLQITLNNTLLMRYIHSPAGWSFQIHANHIYVVEEKR